MCSNSEFRKFWKHHSGSVLFLLLLFLLDINWILFTGALIILGLILYNDRHHRNPPPYNSAILVVAAACAGLAGLFMMLDVCNCKCWTRSERSLPRMSAWKTCWRISDPESIFCVFWMDIYFCMHCLFLHLNTHEIVCFFSGKNSYFISKHFCNGFYFWHVENLFKFYAVISNCLLVQYDM